MPYAAPMAVTICWDFTGEIIFILSTTDKQRDQKKFLCDRNLWKLGYHCRIMMGKENITGLSLSFFEKRQQRLKVQRPVYDEHALHIRYSGEMKYHLFFFSFLSLNWKERIKRFLEDGMSLYFLSLLLWSQFLLVLIIVFYFSLLKN